MVDKHLPTSITTAKGYLTQERQHLQSTQRTAKVERDKKTQHLQSTKRSEEVENKHPITDLCEKINNLSLQMVNGATITDDNHFPQSPCPNTKTNAVAYVIINHDDDNVGYMDLAGCFPQRSSRGNEYVLVGYHFDGNAILASAVKNRTANSLTTA